MHDTRLRLHPSAAAARATASATPPAGRRHRWPAGVGAGLLLAALSACNGGDDAATDSGLAVHLSVAPVSGASCGLSDASQRALGDKAVTQNGNAVIHGLGSASGPALLTCTGGSYVDAATGLTVNAPTLRSWTALNGSAAAANSAANGTAVVSPLTEIAVRVLGSRGPAAYATVLGQVSKSVGIGGLGLTSVVPTDLQKTAATDGDATRYGLALAALSQLQRLGTQGSSLDQLMTALAANIDANGYPKELEPGDDYLDALEDALLNPRLAANIGAIGTRLALLAFDAIADDVPLARITSVQADLSPTRAGPPSHDIQPDVASVLLLGGLNLDNNLAVTLGGKVCRLRDETPLRDERETDDEEVTADCPAQPAGTAQLVVRDAGFVVSQTALNVTASARATIGARALAVVAPAAVGSGPATVSGTVTAAAPTIGTPASPAAHNYAAARTFAVKGVVVELLDRAANDAVLMQTSTDAQGKYSFVGADAGKRVVVRVKAQLAKSRAAGVATGGKWNVSVRDNTSTTLPRALYVLDSAEVTTADGTQAVDLHAGLGFNADGSAQSASGVERRSAPFSILEVAYSALTKIEVTDANVTFPDVNVYWSPKNVGTDGDKEQGQIGTSHYADSGNAPGVYILGRADADTDEFDQGVIGHEFGHWLQSALSYADNPGGSHATAEFKDASLAYGEGYGTALGGLLMSNPLYIDTSGDKQGRGGVTDLDKATPSGVRKGFYSEESVGYVLYQIGKRNGFSAFWQAVSAMKQSHHSATVFAFLSRYLALNPGAQIADLLATENIRSTDPLATLPAGSLPDPALVAAANKGKSASGADDLETLYLPLNLQASAAPTSAVEVTPNAARFCVNHNLKGAELSNGLGMLKRFVFKANFTGPLGIKVLNDAGRDVEDKNYNIRVRSEAGTDLGVFGWSDGNANFVQVQDGVTYTLRFQRTSTDVPQGNQCGNRMSLWRLAS